MRRASSAGGRRLGLEADRRLGDVRRVDRRAGRCVRGGRVPYHMSHDSSDSSTIVTHHDQALADAVQAARRAQGLSTSALAERSGVSRAMIAKIERAEAQPTAALLGASPERSG